MRELSGLREDQRLAYALWMNGKLERANMKKIVGARTLGRLEEHALVFTVKE
jgi:hypothetical protein